LELFSLEKKAVQLPDGLLISFTVAARDNPLGETSPLQIVEALEAADSPR
jgi:hypothetical protein